MRVRRRRHRFPWFVAGLAVLLTLTAGQAVRISAQAGVRRPPQPKEHFKSGAQRSEALLADILSTLRRMDERMSRIEKRMGSAAAVRQGTNGGSKRKF